MLRKGGVSKNVSLNELFGSRWAKKVKINADYKKMKVFFDLACMSTCCWRLPKPKCEPFITHNRGPLSFFRTWMKEHVFLCGSVVEHCVSSAKGCGFDSQGTHILMKMYNLNATVRWIKASAKCINVNVRSYGFGTTFGWVINYRI